MLTLEIRLLKTGDRAAIVYYVDCPNDRFAKAALLALQSTVEERFEIWRGMEMLADGPQQLAN